LFSADFCHPTPVSKDTPSDLWTRCLALAKDGCNVALSTPQPASDTAPATPGYGCSWSDGKDLIPAHEFCAPMDLTLDVQLIQKCIASDAAATCDQGCQWRKGTDSTVVDPKPTDGQVPLFSEDFCHPVIVNKDTASTVWDGCIAHPTSTACSISAGCNWSTGKELIPTGDFCAPMDLTKDVKLIQTCLASETDATCVNGCQWRHGTDTKPTGPEPKPLFQSDFCHPVKISKETTETEWSVCTNEGTPTDCSLQKGCNWSTGKELIPEHPFCAPADLTDDLTIVKKCIEADVDT
jgi:hypothetical protein